MPGIKKSGFTLIEIMVAIMIIALMATIVVPNLSRLSPRYERETFISQLNNLVGFAWQNAIVTNKFHKIWFDTENNLIRIEIASGKTNKQGEPEYEPLKEEYTKTKLEIPSNLSIQAFYIEGNNALKEGKRIWFFMVPDGLSQQVKIIYADEKDLLPSGAPKKFSITLNPFFPQFTEENE